MANTCDTPCPPGPPVAQPNNRACAAPNDVFSYCDTNPITDYSELYCCPSEGNPFSTDTSTVCGKFQFPANNDEGEPMLKSPLNATSKAPWVRIAFQEYFCSEGNYLPDNNATSKTVITVGNQSQPFNADLCTATIKSFQYGWGTVDAGYRCRITILDEKGSSFEDWVTRLVANPEGASKPVQGVYRMKVQFGWYISGGGSTDVCGQQANPNPNTPPVPGQNSSYLVCSPVMWFLPDMISVQWEEGKFVYELEGVDLLVRGQEQVVQKVLGGDAFENQMYFTEAVTLLGKQSYPPFRVRFLAIGQDGKVTSMQFKTFNAMDDCCLGPFGKWSPYGLKPLAAIQKWLHDTPGVWAIDLTSETDNSQIGITVNVDAVSDVSNNAGMNGNPAKQIVNPISDCEVCIQNRTSQSGCQTNLPDFGSLILWASNGVPNCQGVYTDDQLNARMKAVYIVNGGDCSPVISFNPVIRWHFFLGLKAGGIASPTQGTVTGQVQGLFDASCPVTGARGNFLSRAVVAASSTLRSLVQSVVPLQATVLHTAGNLPVHAIEAELRVEGDPSFWLCTPYAGYARCVGIIFVNPFYLTGTATCPQFAQPGSACNNILTNKGWFVKGVEHQITEGNYITTLKVVLPAPGAELQFAGNPANAATKLIAALGAWISGKQVDWSLTFSTIFGFGIGSGAASGVASTPVPGDGCSWTGGGALCPNGLPCNQGQIYCDCPSSDPGSECIDNCDIYGECSVCGSYVNP